VTGTVSNNGTYTIASVTAGTITLIAADTLTAEAAGSQFTIASILQSKVYYAKEFTDLSADSATPALAEYLHLGMVHYVVALGYESRGYGDKANNAWQQYEANIKRYLGARILDKDHREATEIDIGKGARR